MEQQRRYPIGVQSFEKIRTDNYTYVDKSRFIPSLLNMGECVFLSRPRRFGKSLLLSMLECYFKGRKELFEGLDISNQETEWRKYPVIHIDFSSSSYSEDGKLQKHLINKMFDLAEEFEVTLRDSDDPPYLFEQLITKVNKKSGEKVVVLIDEYDTAVIDAAHNEDLKLKNSDTLRAFYKVLKSADQYLKFTMLTGVVRVAQLSIFSGLNNLSDITMLSQFSDICGITPEELKDNFHEGILKLGDAMNKNYEETLLELRKRYNGYRFTKKDQTVFNPFSIINVLCNSELQDYWVKTGTSKIFVDYLKRPDFSLPDVTDKWYDISTLEQVFNSPNPVSLMFQTGYLTIDDYDGYESYRLRYPNVEVTRGLLQVLVPTFLHTGKNDQLLRRLTLMRQYVESGDVDSLMLELQSMLGSVTYDDWDKKRLEKHFETLVYIIFMMLGISSRCQTHIATGRIDMLAETDKFVYVFEYKLDSTAQAALDQINSKDYTLPWRTDGRQVLKIGVNFSSETNSITDWVVEK